MLTDKPDAVTSWWRSISLRAKVTGVTVAVLAIGLFTAGLGTMVFLRNALYTNLDSQVQQLAQADLAKSVFDVTIHGDGITFTANKAAPIDYSGYFVAVYAADGTMLASAGPRVENTPIYPARMTVLHANDQGTSPFSIAGTTGPDFRASLTTFLIDDRAEFFTQLVALPTASVNRIVGTFLGIYSILAVLTMIMGALVTRWLVTLAFRSLGQVETTAMAISAGDFSQRLSDIEPEHTEVGRLKVAINAMLDRLDSALGQRDAAVKQMRRFVGDASHELRTPLVSVRGYAELYRMGAIRGDDDVAQAMERIEKEAVRMGVLVEDLLALTRLDERREELTLTPVDLRPIARDAALDVRAASPSRPVRVQDTTTTAPVTLPHLVIPTAAASASGRGRRSGPGHTRVPGRSLLRRKPRTTSIPAPPEPEPTPQAVTAAVPVVLGEENRIRQVVTNLLANARRYTAEDSPIDLLVGVDAPTATGWIAVADHGDGIPEQIRRQIFQRFWRADTSRTRETGGSGLGLSIVAAIVAALHGSVSVEETPGGGATFRVSLPLAQTSPDDARQAEETPPAVPPEDADTGASSPDADYPA